MKKIFLLAIAVVACATFNTAEAAKKNKKSKKNKTEAKAPVKMVTASDSISYAAGVAMTNGLLPYLINNQGVDTAYMADFVRGFNDIVAGGDNPQMKAYAAGMAIANQVKGQMLGGLQGEFAGTPDSISKENFFRGFTDALTGDTTVMKQADAESLFAKKSAEARAAKQEREFGANRDAGRKFLAENKTKPGVQTTASGLQYKVLTKGEGAMPKATDRVMVHYEGRLVDGTVFDASSKHGSEPMVFGANQVIKGWTEALCMMPVGSKWELYIPYELAYGERNAGMIKPYSMLIFTVELVGIE